MRRFLFAAAVAALFPISAMGQVDQPGDVHLQKTDGSTEGGWVVGFPTGSSDYFNVRFDGPAATIVGGTVAVADFGAGTTYPRLGAYASNLGVDPSGNTPDLGSPFVEVSSPAILGGPIGGHVDVVTAPTPVPAGPSHCGIQLPPGDSGLLGVHGDSDASDRGGNSSPGSPDPNDSSGFTQDGYATPGVQFSPTEFGLGTILDPTDGFISGNDGYFTFTVNSDLTGDFTTVTTIAGDAFGVAFFGPKFAGGPTSWVLFISFLGAPVQKVGPILPTIPDAAHTYLRLSDFWPSNAGNFTLNFVAVSGASGVLGSVGISNEVTVHALPDPGGGWGTWDDGSYETGWVVSFPTGSSDYFNVNYGNPGGAVTGDLDLAVMDFGSPFTSYPSAGFAPPNLGVDGSGNTPDIGNAYVSGAITGFPAGTFVSTSGQLVTRSLGGYSPAGDAGSFVQFPPGDSGLLGIGGDTNGLVLAGKNGWTLDGYTTPANIVAYANWGIRGH